ncbi:Ger(x)C family spore germination protein [Paenibacillus contaminans]|uniref:Ger(X)C family spore germination protein n=1 Tax=Paenibacillus contaminans TaxID=450362 RepID=A0A329LLY2_9BACL|nr:Ger(x)C family spore germination protein [Paenibacillus contaminans]RAV08042.1 hypothetical protein DQG23_41465 [Paenibacillus contaminans]
MKLRRLTAVFLALSLLLVSGCGSAKDADMLDYINGIGVDYQNGEYIVYLQMLSVSNIAKTEGKGPSESTPYWVAVGKGKNLTEAIGKIYNASAKSIFWGHVTALLLSESLLESNELSIFMKEFDRFHETRYTSWVFATSEAMNDIFMVKPNFEQSRLNTRLHNPEEGYHILSLVRPLMLHDFVADFQDQGRSTLLPSLKVTSDNWEKDREKKTSLEVNGVHAFQNTKYKGFIPVLKLFGTRWLEKETVQSFISVQHDGKTAATIKMTKPKSSIRIMKENGKVRFGIKVIVKGILTHKFTDISVEELRRGAEKQIAEEIRRTFEEGLRVDADLLQLNEKLHRFHHKLWKAAHPGGPESAALTADSLGPIDVVVDITQTGKYKY